MDSKPLPGTGLNLGFRLRFDSDAGLMTASPAVDGCVVPPVVSVETVHTASPGALVFERRPKVRSVRFCQLAKLGGVALLIAGLVGAGIALIGLAGAARQTPWRALLTSPWMLVLMVGAMAGGYLMQSLSLFTLISRRAHARDFFLLPWACASVNRVTPGSAGGLLLTTRVLHRRGMTLASSAVYLASVGVTHTLGGLLLLGIAVGAGGMTDQYGVPLGGPGLFLSLLGIVVLAVLMCLPRTRERARAMIRQARGELSLRRLPALLVFQAGARLAPAVVLAGALAGLHHPLPFPTVVVIVLVAGATGSLVPLPGGGGGVELALTGLLTASGLPFSAASASVLVARLIGFWLPAALGLPALVALRRSVACPATATPVSALEGAHGGDAVAPEPAVVPVLRPGLATAAA